MDRDPGSRQRASLRASDADREGFVQALRQHHVEGRLTTDELAERTQQAYAARTFGDLDALAADLPPIRPPAPPPGRPASADLPPRLRPPGPSRAAAKAALVRSVLWFGMISVVLLVIWAMTGREYFWPVWPILGFMLAIGWQVFSVYYGPARFDDDQPRPRDR
jgi:uncharacterized protein DUF1707/2TM domain-containing protein